MGKILLFIALVLCATPYAFASNVNVNIGVNVGDSVPVYVEPPVVITKPPLFLAPPELGFYVAVGVGYDLFLSGNVYYLHNGNNWYSSPYYNGPWKNVGYKRIPYGIRKHSYKRIRHYRDVSYKKYKAGDRSFKQKRFQPKWRKHSVGKPGKKSAPRGKNHSGYKGRDNKQKKQVRYDKPGTHDKKQKSKENPHGGYDKKSSGNEKGGKSRGDNENHGHGPR